jgi:hypothetical protein
MLNQRAEIVFHHHAEMDAAVATLTEQGLAVSALSWVDGEEHSAGWIAADAVTEFDHDDFVDWINTTIRAFRGVVIEAGPIPHMGGDGTMLDWSLRIVGHCGRKERHDETAKRL